MNCAKKYPLSLDGDTFNAFKTDFDMLLRKLLTEMEKRETEDATISIKIAVNLQKGQERDFETNGYNAMKDITKPTFKHEISTVLQVKDKKTGNLGGNMKLVWDRALCQYVLQEIDNGQMSIFNGEDQELERIPVRRGTLALTAGKDDEGKTDVAGAIDADFREVTDDIPDDGYDYEDRDDYGEDE